MTHLNGLAEPAELVSRWRDCLYEPDDIIEIRCVPEIRKEGAKPLSRWVSADALLDELDWMRSQQLEHERFPCLGVHPRTHKGGRKDAHVREHRALFVDIDDADEDDALARLEMLGVPLPGYAQASGHGVHLVWRLDRPLPSDAWKRAQKQLVERLGGDGAAKDPSRVLRAPGFPNRKHARDDGAFPKCRIIWAEPSRRLPLTDVPWLIGDDDDLHPQTRRYLRGECADGERHAGAKAACADMIGRGREGKSVLARLEAAGRKCGLDEDRAYYERLVAWAVEKRAEPRWKEGDGTTSVTPPKAEAESDLELRVVRLSEVTPEEVEWLIPDLVPFGGLTLLGGLQGLGKSTVALDLLARLTRGTEWPCGLGAIAAPAEGLVFACEEQPEVAHAPRFAAAGGDASRVLFARGVMRDEEPLEFSSRRHARLVRGLLRDHPAVRLVVLDPLTSYLDGEADQHSNAEVRAALQPWVDISAEFRIAVLGIVHPRKGDSARAIHQVLGSQAFTAVARSVLLVDRDRDDKRRRFLIPSKGNWAPDAESLVFEIETAHVPGNGPNGQVRTSRIVWDGLEDIDADEHFSESRRAAPKLEMAMDFYRDVLRHGPVKSAEVKRYAEERRKSGALSASDRTLDEARARLGVKTANTFGGPHWLALPEHADELECAVSALAGTHTQNNCVVVRSSAHKEESEDTSAHESALVRSPQRCASGDCEHGGGAS